MTGREALRILSMINKLREDEGSSVTIVCDNPEFSGPACQIQVFGDWTNWVDQHIYGESIAECLKKALEVKRNYKPVHWPLYRYKCPSCGVEDEVRLDEVNFQQCHAICVGCRLSFSIKHNLVKVDNG